jgi:hypothetical protein
VINHTQIAHVCVINTHSSARFNRGLDDFAQLVHNVTRSVENITARIIRAIRANDQRFNGLITGSRAFLNRRWDDRSRFGELKRRNVYKVAVAYAVVAWLLVQVATQVFPFFEVPNGRSD